MLFSSFVLNYKMTYSLEFLLFIYLFLVLMVQNCDSTNEHTQKRTYGLYNATYMYKKKIKQSTYRVNLSTH